MAVPGMAGVGDPTGGHLQGREQRGGAVAEVVLGAPLDPSRRHWLDRLGPLQRPDLGLLVHTHSTMACAGGSRYSPTTSRTLASSCGSVENSNVSTCYGRNVVLGPDPRHRAVADTQLAGQQPRGPVGHAEVLRWRGQRGSQDLRASGPAHGLEPATVMPVGQPPAEPLLAVALAPGDHRRSTDPKPLGDLAPYHGISAAIMANHGNGFRLSEPFSTCRICHPLQPLGSINAPSAGDRLGVRAPTPCADRCSGEILSSSSVR